MNIEEVRLWREAEDLCEQLKNLTKRDIETYPTIMDGKLFDGYVDVSEKAEKKLNEMQKKILYLRMNAEMQS